EAVAGEGLDDGRLEFGDAVRWGVGRVAGVQRLPAGLDDVGGRREVRFADREVDDVDAVAVIGAIVSGDTDHDQVIADAAAGGLTDVSLERDTPVTFGVTGPGMSAAEAEARIHRGGSAVESAIALAEELRS
ncbi:hypothetical protein BRD11_01125, partial [Halobacteriales archaeon SW_12_69_24]